MAKSLPHSPHHHSTTHLRRWRHPLHPPTPAPLFLKSPSSSSTTTLSLTTTTSLLSCSSTSSTTTTTPSTSDDHQSTTFTTLHHHLSTQNFREADEETRRLLIALAGEPAKKRGYVFFSEVQFISAADLAAIDELWRKHSNGRFGYSVQKRIWEKSNKDFTKFFFKVGWMKKLDNSEVDQLNYRSFPDEFIWELSDGTPEGHLPLTNALRGTQLLNSILMHPAFEGAGEGEEISQGGEEEGNDGGADGKVKPSSPFGAKRLFKTSYSF